MKARNLPKIKLFGIFFGVAFRLVVVVVISIVILMSVLGYVIKGCCYEYILFLVSVDMKISSIT
jgi:hypothetical protein